jgi:hypothetical protein
MLQDTIVKFAVGEKAEAGAWCDLVMQVHAMSLESRYDEIVVVLKNSEKLFKEVVGATQCPATYRSAKSVVLKALRKGVDLVGDNNEPLGKSAVEVMCKEERPLLNNVDAMYECIEKMRKRFVTITDEGEQTAVKHYIETTIPSIWGY